MHCAMDLYWFWVFVASFFSWILIQFLSGKQNQRSRKLKLPPSPKAWPVIGHLHMASKLNHRGLRELSLKYGPIFLLKLGRVNTVVVSSAEIATTVLKAQDHVFDDRPRNSATDNLLYNSSDISFGAYGAHWRLLRKIATTHMLGSNAVKALSPFIERHVCEVVVDPIVEELKNSVNPQVRVNLKEVLYKMANSLISEIVVGNQEWEWASELKELSREYSYLLATPDIGDCLPWLAWLDLLGLRRRQKIAATKAEHLYGKVLTDHAAKSGIKEERRPDFVDALLNYDGQIGRNAMKALIVDMLQAGTNTTYTTLEWAMAEVLRNTEAMQRAQAELRSVVGPTRRVSLADVERLPYIRAVVKETLRLHTAAPLLLPRRARADCNVAGYLVPRGSTVVVNAWATSRDPAAWGPQAEKFLPDRFIMDDAYADPASADMWWAFGGGRRACPGMFLGLTVVEFVVAQLLHSFHWSLGSTAELDMSERVTLVLMRATPLIAMATPGSAASVAAPP